MRQDTPRHNRKDPSLATEIETISTRRFHATGLILSPLPITRYARAWPPTWNTEHTIPRKRYQLATTAMILTQVGSTTATRLCFYEFYHSVTTTSPFPKLHQTPTRIPQKSFAPNRQQRLYTTSAISSSTSNSTARRRFLVRRQTSASRSKRREAANGVPVEAAHIRPMGTRSSPPTSPLSLSN